MKNVAICELLHGDVWTMVFEHVSDNKIKVLSYDDKTTHTQEERAKLAKLTPHGNGHGVIISIDLDGTNLEIVNPKSIGTY